MALPEGYDIKKYLPTEDDFAAVFKAKQNGNYHNLPYYPLGKDEPYYYPTVRIYLATILLKWEELGKQIENSLLAGKYEYINSNKQLVPYYTPQDLALIRAIAIQNKQFYVDAYMKYREASHGIESPEKLTQTARDARKGEIESKVKGTGNLVRILPYSMKYGSEDPNKKQSGARMYLFFGKDIGGKYSIVIRGSNLYGSGKSAVLDEPFFVTEQEARDFVANVDHTHIETKVTLEDWRFVLSDKPIEDGWKEVGRRIINGTDCGPEYAKDYVNIKLKDAIKVDTICGPAYMLKSCKLLKK